MSDTIATEENVSTEQQGSTETNGAPTVANGKEFKFFFKTEKVKDAEGKEIGEGKKHPDVKAILPVPTREEVIAAVADESSKVGSYIMDLIYDGVADAARAQLNQWRADRADTQGNLPEFKATNFDLTKLTLEVIANLPKGQRGAWAPSDEDHKDFAEAYRTVLVHKINYDEKKTQNHLDHFKNGFAKIKTNKPVLAKLQEFLTLFAANVEEEIMEENTQTYNWLTSRLDRYLKAEEKNLLEAL